MNYYNPYFYSMPTTSVTPKVGLLTRLFGRSGATISGFLNGTQRVLNFANQAIPLVKQVKPMIGNAKTMFKVMNEFKRTEKPNNTNVSSNENNIITESQSKTIETNNETTNEIVNNNGPTFFM